MKVIIFFKPVLSALQVSSLTLELKELNGRDSKSEVRIKGQCCACVVVTIQFRFLPISMLFKLPQNIAKLKAATLKRSERETSNNTMIKVLTVSGLKMVSFFFRKNLKKL